MLIFKHIFELFPVVVGFIAANTTHIHTKFSNATTATQLANQPNTTIIN
jgi:hypothetical protein